MPTSNEDNNMVLVAEREYCDGDSGCSCGSGGAGHLVSETRWVDDSTSHTTEFEYDWRGRRLHVFPPADDAGRVVYTTTTYDNLDRAIRQERYLEIVAGTDRLLARSDSFYDDRGRVFQTARYAVDVDTGTVGNALVSNTWFDAAGSVIKQQPAGSQAFTTDYGCLSSPGLRACHRFFSPAGATTVSPPRPSTPWARRGGHPSPLASAVVH